MKNSKKLADLTNLKAVEKPEEVKGGIFFHLLYAKVAIVKSIFSYGHGNNYGYSNQSHGYSSKSNGYDKKGH